VSGKLGPNPYRPTADVRQFSVTLFLKVEYADYFLHSFLPLDCIWCYSISRNGISWRKIIKDDATKLAAAAALKVRQETEKTSVEFGDAFVAYMDDSTEGPESKGAQQPDNLTTSVSTHQWFRKRQKNRGAPRLLEVPNEVLVSNGGPLQITGNIILAHEDGRVQYVNHLSLCRCGHSRSKPVCDGQHVDMEFINSGKIFDVSEVAASSHPNRITISCIKDGPIKFLGRMRLHNKFGQECVKMHGSLCRCGQSARKPFCDGSHSRVGFKTG
jgi:CDGSH-type Zn-finger protein